MVAALAKKAALPSGTLDWALQQLRSSRTYSSGKALHQALLAPPAGTTPRLPCQEAEEELGLAALRLDGGGSSSSSSRCGAAGGGEQLAGAPALQGDVQARGNCSRPMEGMVDMMHGIPSWPPRKPLVQWAAQLECYGGSRFAPHHVGAQPSKPCLRRASAGVELAPGEEALQLEKLSSAPMAAMPKSAVLTHPKATGQQVVGIKRSRMAAFR